MIATIEPSKRFAVEKALQDHKTSLALLKDITEPFFNLLCVVFTINTQKTRNEKIIGRFIYTEKKENISCSPALGVVTVHYSVGTKLTSQCVGCFLQFHVNKDFAMTSVKVGILCWLPIILKGLSLQNPSTLFT